MKVAKIINEESELRLLRDKNKNKKIVLTSGCFDLLHYGHICHLEESKNCGDYLVVAVNSDDSEKRLKGNTKPVVPENQRIKILQALRFVDAVFVFDEDDVCKYFEILKPDCFTIGEESAIDYYNEIVAAQNSKTLVHIIKRRKDYSTTKIINKIKEENYRE